MWYNLSLDGVNFRSGYLHKLGVYTEFVTVPGRNTFGWAIYVFKKQ